MRGVRQGDPPPILFILAINPLQKDLRPCHAHAARSALIPPPRSSKPENLTVRRWCRDVCDSRLWPTPVGQSNSSGVWICHGPRHKLWEEFGSPNQLRKRRLDDEHSPTVHGQLQNVPLPLPWPNTTYSTSPKKSYSTPSGKDWTTAHGL
jgi:hypothetical protein